VSRWSIKGGAWSNDQGVRRVKVVAHQGIGWNPNHKNQIESNRKWPLKLSNSWIVNSIATSKFKLESWGNELEQEWSKLGWVAKTLRSVQPWEIEIGWGNLELTEFLNSEK